MLHTLPENSPCPPDIDRDCAICSGMAGVMDALYWSMNEECAAYLSHITITDIETQLFTQK